MQHFTFGRNNGLRVTPLALGTAMFGTGWGHGSDEASSVTMLDMFAEAGGTFLDTADTYQFGQSEDILGAWLDGRRDQFTVATKYTRGAHMPAQILATGNGRRNLITSVEASLRRLRTDYIDLLWVHYPDPVTPMDEIWRGLDDLASAGKILYAGLSNFPAWRSAHAATLADLRGWIPLAGLQFEYSLVERSGDRENLPLAEAFGLGACLWSPLGGGLLTGKYRGEVAGGRLTQMQRLIHTEDQAHTTAILDAVIAVAEGLGIPPAQVAVAWLLHKATRSTTGLVTITGPRTPEQLSDYLAALDVTLDDDAYTRLDDASRIDLGQPHNEIVNGLARTLGDRPEDFRLHPLAVT